MTLRPSKRIFNLYHQHRNLILFIKAYPHIPFSFEVVQLRLLLVNFHFYLEEDLDSLILFHSQGLKVSGIAIDSLG